MASQNEQAVTVTIISPPQKNGKRVRKKARVLSHIRNGVVERDPKTGQVFLTRRGEREGWSLVPDAKMLREREEKLRRDLEAFRQDQDALELEQKRAREPKPKRAPRPKRGRRGRQPEPADVEDLEVAPDPDDDPRDEGGEAEEETPPQAS